MRGTPRSLPASVPRARLCSDPLVYGAIPSWDSKRREGSGDLLIHFVSPVLVYTAGAQQMLINKWVKRDVGPNRESIIGLPQRSRKLSELKLGGPWKGLDYNNWALTIFPALDVDYLNESSWRHRRNKIRQGKERSKIIQPGNGWAAVHTGSLRLKSTNTPPLFPPATDWLLCGLR